MSETRSTEISNPSSANQDHNKHGSHEDSHGASELIGDVLHNVSDTIASSHAAGVHLPKGIELIGAVATISAEYLHKPSIEGAVCNGGIALAKETIAVGVAAEVGAAVGAISSAGTPATGIAACGVAAVGTYKVINKVLEPYGRLAEKACYAGFQWARTQLGQYKSQQQKLSQVNLTTSRMSDHARHTFIPSSNLSFGSYFGSFHAQPYSFASPQGQPFYHFSNKSLSLSSSFSGTPSYSSMSLLNSGHSTQSFSSYLRSYQASQKQSMLQKAVNTPNSFNQKQTQNSTSVFSTYMYSVSNVGLGYTSLGRFSNLLKSTGLTKSFNAANPGSIVRDVAKQKREIGGIGHDVSIIADMIDSEAHQAEEFFFCFLAQNFPLSQDMCRQIIHELAEIYFIHKTFPFFSLHFNNSGFTYPVIHPAYENTLVGLIVAILDYWLKGYLNGGIYDEQFTTKWHHLINCDETELRQKLIDLKKYCHENARDLNYASLRQRKSEAGLREEINAHDMRQSAYQQPFMTSFRILSYQHDIKRNGNVLLFNPDIRVEYSIDTMPDYQHYVDEYMREKGCYPKDYEDILFCYQEFAEEIKEKLPQLPFCQEYFRLLGIMNSLCYFYATLEKMGKRPVFDVPNNDTFKQYSVPKAFPPIPVRYYKTYPVQMTFGDILSHSNILVDTKKIDESILSLFSQKRIRTLPVDITQKIRQAIVELIKEKLKTQFPDENFEVHQDEIDRLTKITSRFLLQQIIQTKKAIDRNITKMTTFLSYQDQAELNHLSFAAKIKKAKELLKNHLDYVTKRWEASKELVTTGIFQELPKELHNICKANFTKIDEEIKKELQEAIEQKRVFAKEFTELKIKEFLEKQTKDLEIEFANVEQNEKEIRIKLTAQEEAINKKLAQETNEANEEIFRLGQLKASLEAEVIKGNGIITQLIQNKNNQINSIPNHLRTANQANINAFVLQVDNKINEIKIQIDSINTNISKIAQEITRINGCIIDGQKKAKEMIAGIQKEINELLVKVAKYKEELKTKTEENSKKSTDDFRKKVEQDLTNEIEQLKQQQQKLTIENYHAEALRLLALVHDKNCQYIDKCEKIINNFTQDLSNNEPVKQQLLAKQYTHSQMAFTGQEVDENFRINGGCGMQSPVINSHPIEQAEEFSKLLAVACPEKAEETGQFTFNGQVYSVFKLAVNDVELTLKVENTETDKTKLLMILEKLFETEIIDESITEALLSRVMDKSDATFFHYAAAFLSANVFAKLMLIAPQLIKTPDLLGHLPIHFAAQMGNTDVITKIVEQDKTQLEVSNYQGGTPLLAAVEQGEVTAVQTLLTLQANVNYQLPNGLFALYIAIQNNDVEIALILLNIPGININEKLDSYMTALHLAIENNMIEVAMRLIHLNAAIDIKRKSDGFTPLFCAAENGQLQLLEAMIARGVYIHTELESKKTILHVASAAGHLHVVKFLISKGAQVDAKTHDGDTPLTLAIKAGHVDVAKELAAITQVDLINKQKQTASLLAIQYGMPVVSDILIKRGEDPKLKNEKGYNYLYYVIRNGEYKRFLALMENKSFDMNECFDEESLLALAAGFGHFYIVTELLDKNAKYINKRTGLSLVHYAVIAREIGFLREWLLEENPNHSPVISSGIDKGRSLAYIAAKHASSQCLDLLLKKMSKQEIEKEELLKASIESLDPKIVRKIVLKIRDINKPIDEQGNTALHFAVRIGSREIVEQLITSGSLLTITNQYGQTPFHIAVMQDDSYLLKRLFKLSKPDEWPRDLLKIKEKKLSSATIKLLAKYEKRLASIKSFNPNQTIEILSTNEVAKESTAVASTTVTAPINELKPDDILELETLIKEENFDEAADLFETKPLLFSLFKTSKGAKLLQMIFANIYDYTSLLKKIEDLKDNNDDIPKLAMPFNRLLLLLKAKGVNPADYTGHDNILITMISARDDEEACYRLNILEKYFPESLATLVNDQFSLNITLAELALRYKKFELFKKLDSISIKQTETKKIFYGIHEAILANNYNLVKELLTKYSPNLLNDKRQTPLMLAAKVNNVQIIELLLHHGASLEARDINGRNALHYAIANGAELAALSLLPLFNNQYQADRGGVTPLMLAATKGMLSIVKYLCRDTSHAYEVDDLGRNALHFAAMFGQVEVIDYLVSRGFSINSIEMPTRASKTKTCLYRTPLHLAAYHGHADAVAKLIQLCQQTQENYELPDKSGRTVRDYAVMSNNPEMLQVIQQLPSYHDEKNNLQLLEAATVSNNKEVIHELILRDANLSSLNAEGQTCLHLAARYNSAHVASILLQGQDIPINFKDRAGNTALHVAAVNGHTRIVELFIKANADINSTTQGNMTALYLACQEGHLGTVTLLINNEADLSICNSDGITPAQIALLNGHIKIVKCLVESGDASLQAEKIDLLPSHIKDKIIVLSQKILNEKPKPDDYIKGSLVRNGIYRPKKIDSMPLKSEHTSIIRQTQ